MVRLHPLGVGNTHHLGGTPVAACGGPAWPARLRVRHSALGALRGGAAAGQVQTAAMVLVRSGFAGKDRDVTSTVASGCDRSGRDPPPVPWAWGAARFFLRRGESHTLKACVGVDKPGSDE